MSEASRVLVGIFVGGRGSRMGGVAKGLLKAPASEATLIERLLGELSRAAPGAEVVLVGHSSAYAALGLRAVDDAPSGIGPLGGLVGLLLDAELLQRLLNEAASATAFVAEQAGVRNPLVARYRVAAALPAAREVMQGGKRSLQAVLDSLSDGVQTLTISAAEAGRLDDWDSPEDVRRG
jgi:molybdopterin-guanine dinucleotide biosynthesis protein A